MLSGCMSSKDFEVVNQIRRSAVPSMTNIVEDFHR